MKKFSLFILFTIYFYFGAVAQKKHIEFSYLNPKEYTVGGIEIQGSEFLDPDVLITIAKIAKGDRLLVPGETTSNAIKNLWGQGLFDDIQLNVSKIQGDTIFLIINVKELRRLSEVHFKGIRKGEIKDLNEKLDVYKGKIVNDNLVSNIHVIIRKFLYEKGFIDADIHLSKRIDTLHTNQFIIDSKIQKGRKVRIKNITFSGSETFTQRKLRKFLKGVRTPFLGFLFPSKFQKDKYEESKEKLIEKLNSLGYKDAEIVSDSIQKVKKGKVNLAIKIKEGKKYYFGHISFAGNAKYSSKILSEILGIKKGEFFSDERLSKHVNSSPNGDDISSLYLNDGYLTFNVEPVQTKIYNDTIDLEIRIFEGPQYIINKVTVKGNDLTNDHVILREVRTTPGQKFSKELVVRTVREIAQLGMFDDQKTDVKPKPNPADGTVDIEYTVGEKPSDQIELSGGYGAGRIIGTLGLTFNNFSAKNLFNKKAYTPLPKGDGQKLSLRGQTNGVYYQSLSLSFSEPWFGGKKPIYLGFSLSTSLMSSSNIYTSAPLATLPYIRITGGSVSLGRRIKWPDDYFQLNNTLNIQHITLNNYGSTYLFATGNAINLSVSQEVSRNSIDAPIYPTSGSYLRFSVQATPPYSLFNGLNYERATDQERYRFTEYHKWKFDAQWFYKIAGKLVLRTQARFGLVGQYNSNAVASPFERFLVGGSGMQFYGTILSAEIIGLRGYQDGSVIPVGCIPNTSSVSSGSPIYNKYTLELRYPVVFSPQATIYITTFAEGGNAFLKPSDFSPFDLRRSVGMGARVFLPIFGMVGLDYGYGFDTIPGNSTANKGQFHFSIAQQLGGFN